MEYHSPRKERKEHLEHEGNGSASLAELLDLDADVLAAYLDEVTTWVRQQAAGLPGRRVLDLGAGTGTGTTALAQRFGEADVVAVDRSEEMLACVRARALSLGLADRIRTVRADADTAWPAIEPVDVAWASNSLHEMSDPDRVLKEVFATIRPGGLLAVVEMDSPPRFLPDDIGLGRPGLESRWRGALAREQAGPPPQPGPDGGPRLEQAGFTLAATRTFAFELTPPHPAPVGRYARAYVRRIRRHLEGRMAADDLAALDALLADTGPGSLLHRDDLIVRGTRTAWLGRRP
jgi:ubiquinone/menaquinone biosynthesis C-methylase UbiE